MKPKPTIAAMMAIIFVVSGVMTVQALDSAGLWTEPTVYAFTAGIAAANGTWMLVALKNEHDWHIHRLFGRSRS